MNSLFPLLRMTLTAISILSFCVGCSILQSENESSPVNLLAALLLLSSTSESSGAPAQVRFVNARESEVTNRLSLHMNQCTTEDQKLGPIEVNRFSFSDYKNISAGEYRASYWDTNGDEFSRCTAVQMEKNRKYLVLLQHHDSIVHHSVAAASPCPGQAAVRYFNDRGSLQSPEIFSDSSCNTTIGVSYAVGSGAMVDYKCVSAGTYYQEDSSNCRGPFTFQLDRQYTVVIDFSNNSFLVDE